MQNYLKHCISLIMLIVWFSDIKAQCPQLNDFFGLPNNAPYWYDCDGGIFTLNINSPNNIGTWTVDWGDGSGIQNGGPLLVGNSITHIYGAAIDTFVVTFTEDTSGCVIQGVVVMEEPSNASIQIPFGGVTQVCAPGDLEFMNSSTDVSPTTVFTWDFGDGSGIQTFDYTNGGQTVTHTYMPGTVNCVTQVTLTAENYCNTIQGGNSTATFNPIRIWDIDDAAINASDVLLCYPDTTVTFQNVTNRNCFAQGNIAQRYEWWNFGDYWGNGYDSIVGWVAWPPALPYTMAYPGVGTYDVMMVDSSFCGLDTAYITIQIVNPPFAALNSSQDTICEGENITFGNLSGGGANSYFWNFGDGSGWNPSAGGNVNHTYNNSGDYTIQVVANINGGTAACTDTASLDIHVLPSPIANFIFDNNNGCDSMYVNFGDASSVDAINWSWDFDNGQTDTIANPPIQFYGSPGNYDVQLTVGNVNGCFNSTNQTFTVYQSPVPAFTPNSVCVNELASFIDNSTFSPGDSILTWDWDFGDGNTSTAQNPFHMYIAPGFYDMILTVNTAFCTGTDTVQINVENVPTAAFSADTTNGCADLLVNFTNSSSVNATNFYWDFGDGDTSVAVNPSHLFLNSFGVDTTYVVSLIAQTAFGCADTITQNITVYPNPSASFTDNAVLDCAPLIIDFTNTSTGGNSYLWNFGDGSPIDTSFSPTHTYQNLTQFIDNNLVSLIVTSLNGCTDTVQKNMVVYPEPQFGFSVNPDSGCSPLVVTFPSVIGAVDYQWDFGDGNVGTGPTPNHTYLNTITNDVVYNVTLTATSPFGCVDTTYGDVLVFPNPSAQFTTDVNNGCHPLGVNYTNISTGGTYYHWNLGDGTVFDTLSSSFSHFYTNTTGALQQMDIELIAETDHGCKDTLVQIVDVYPDVTAIMQVDTFGCTPFITDFTSFSIGAVKYYWDFGDGSPIDTTQNPSHTFINSGNTDAFFTVQLIIESVYGCFDTTYQDILVYPATIAQTTVDNFIGCHPLTVQFTNNSIGGFNYYWNFGDGSTLDTTALVFDHVFYNTTGVTQNFQIQLISETDKGCRDTTYQSIDVYPDIQAIFVADTAGCSPLLNAFVNNSIGANTYIWNFGDGTPTENFPNPTHNFTNTTPNDVTYTVSLIAESIFGCRDTVQHPVTVYATPMASFTPSPFSQTYPNTSISINNTTSSGAWQYTWDYGDGTISNLTIPPNHVYTTWGTYTVSVLVEGTHCSDTALRIIEIIPPIPIANFTGPATGCRPLQVQFQNSSQYGFSYSWNFGDGGISSQLNPTYTYYNPGIYTVTLTVTGDGGTDVMTQNQIIEVYEIPNAFFTVSPSIVNLPGQPAVMYNLSNFAATYVWDFGDGTTSTETNPEHVYTEEGFYDITLIATSVNNCVDTFKIFSAVEAIAEGDIKIPNAFTPNSGGSNGGIYDPRSMDNDVFHPIITGADKYELNIFNKWGELLFISTDMSIGWDGYYRGELCQQDVYVYKIKVTYIDGTTETFVGDLTLLR